MDIRDTDSFQACTPQQGSLFDYAYPAAHQKSAAKTTPEAELLQHKAEPGSYLSFSGQDPSADATGLDDTSDLLLRLTGEKQRSSNLASAPSATDAEVVDQHLETLTGSEELKGSKAYDVENRSVMQAQIDNMPSSDEQTSRSSLNPEVSLEAAMAAPAQAVPSPTGVLTDHDIASLDGASSFADDSLDNQYMS